MPTMISIPTSSILPPVALPQDVKDALAEASAGIAKEALAGRLQSKESFNWVPSDMGGNRIPTSDRGSGGQKKQPVPFCLFYSKPTTER